MVKKKTGELRFCCDFRPLNDVTVKDAFPLLRIDESLSRIGNAKIFTSIDLAWASWQIPLKKCNQRKTAFACELVLFEWRRMPPLGCATPQLLFNAQLREPCRNFNKGMGASLWPTLTTSSSPQRQSKTTSHG